MYDSYGPARSPAELFLDYSFVDDYPEHKARANLPASALGPLPQPNAALLAEVGLPQHAATAVFSPDGPGDGVLAWARAVCATPEELRRAGWASQPSQRGGRASQASRLAHVAMASFAERVGGANERAAVGMLLQACSSQLAAQDLARAEVDPAAQDAALARTGVAGAAALRAVESERAALMGSVEVLKAMLAKVVSRP